MIKVKHRKPSQKRDASAHECKYVDSVGKVPFGGDIEIY